MPSIFSTYEDPTLTKDVCEMTRQGSVWGRRVTETSNSVLGNRIDGGTSNGDHSRAACESNASSSSTRSSSLVEGFTTAFPNAALDEIQMRDTRFTQVTDDVRRKMSELARAQTVVNTETNNYLQSASRDTKYLNQIVRLGDGTIGYVTNQGVFKRFNSQADVDATLGKNGCPAGITGLTTDQASTYSADGNYVNADVPLFVGTPMVREQQCGYAGQNIFVGKKESGSGVGDYMGCKRANDSLIPTGFRMNVEAPACPVGTFQCPGGQRGYCYDPRRDQMVSTFMNPTYDSPIGSSAGNAPFLADDGVTQLWFRQGGFDGSCGTKPTMPPCPVGTAPCATGNRPGYCWDPSRKMMVTTVSPNGTSVDNDAKPNYMYLVKGDAFTYDESNDPHVTVSMKSNVDWRSMQGWVPDSQFTNQSVAATNKVYYQFKAAAAKMMPHLGDGESGKLTVLTLGNVIRWNTQGRYNNAVAGSAFINGVGTFGKNIQLSNVRDQAGNLIPNLDIIFRTDTLYVQSPRPDSNTSYTYYFSQPVGSLINTSGGQGFSAEGAVFTVTKTGDRSADATLTYGGNTMTVSYTFQNALPKMKPGMRSQDGSTLLWKEMDGYDSGCGAEPQVPPVVQGNEFLEKCRDIANAGGFGVYGIMDGECYIGESGDSLAPGSGCSSVGQGMVGTGGNIGAYKLTGNKNTGMFQYGYVTADETLKQYPADLQRVTGRFTGIGRKQIARTPRNQTFTGVADDATCKAKCISTFGDSCEAYNYNVGSQSCVAYGADAIASGVIIPVGESELMIRQKELNNDETCPKQFATVSSSVWENLPKDSMMTPDRKCNLGYRTEQSMAVQQGAVADLTNSLYDMQQFVNTDVDSAKQLQPGWGQGLSQIQNTLQEYQRIYQGN